MGGNRIIFFRRPNSFVQDCSATPYLVNSDCDYIGDSQEDMVDTAKINFKGYHFSVCMR